MLLLLLLLLLLSSLLLLILLALSSLSATLSIVWALRQVGVLPITRHASLNFIRLLRVVFDVVTEGVITTQGNRMKFRLASRMLPVDCLSAECARGERKRLTT